jgi:hypothetical protein
MSEDNQVEATVDVVEEEAPAVEAPAEAEPTQSDEIERIVEERLAKMKSNMNSMAEQRDAALKAQAQMEEAKKAETMKRLEEEGKLQELAEMKVAELEAKLAVFEEQNTKLTRDGVLNDALSGLDFRNDRSREMARKDILDSVQQIDGQWKHTSGMTIKDFVESYAQSEDNSFLFRIKSNTGAGTGNSAGAPSMEAKKAIGDMSTSEILALAAKGKLGNMGY